MNVLIHDYAGHPFQFSLSQELARRGHSVTHAYFAGDGGPKGDLMRRPGDPENLRVRPVEIGRTYRKGALLSRRQNDLRYGRAAQRLVRELRPDVVLSGNTPLDAQGCLQHTTKRVGSIFINWIQDFYSVAIKELLSARWLGLGQIVAMHYQRMERKLLRSSSHIVVISDDFRPHIQRIGIPLENVTTIPNWGPIEHLPLRPKANSWSCAHGLADKFVFAYSGTLGLKHNPELLLQLAERFRSRPEVVIVVAAAGVGLQRLQARLASTPCDNLRLFHLVDFADYADFLGTADVLVGLLEQAAGSFSVPSKVLAYLCAGRPILLSAPLLNQAAEVVTRAQAGMVTPPDAVEEFLAAADHLFQNEILREAAARQGRAYAEQHFELNHIADHFEGMFTRLARNAGRRIAPRKASRLGAASASDELAPV